MEHSIITDNLVKTYSGGIQALKGVNLKVPAGCCFGLLGANGAGKSTLIKCLLSIVHITSGNAELAGISVKKSESRRSVGYLSEGHSFPKYLTAAGVCRYFGRLSGLSGSALEKEIDEKLALVEMSDWKKMKVSKFSKGMNQRIGIAQALMGNPNIVFLDEPTDGVDPVIRLKLRKVITEFCNKGSTVFINSHLLSEVEVVCDQIAIMNKGKIIHQGSVAEITSNKNKDGGLKVIFKTSQISNDSWNHLSSQGAEKIDTTQFSIQLESEQNISSIVDVLRKNNIDIYAIEPVKLGLEDFFLELANENPDKGETI
ncbi:MAG: ABC transporter ATP-binding protein [Planctomycetota bacterium]|nr:MAG: ABC transporter ATP-binding protein [Planctomycetota bacterium]